MCNFIMIMILLVTAYNGIAEKGRRGGETHMVTANTSVGLACALPGWHPCWASRLWFGWRCIFWQQLAARAAGSSRGSPSK